MGYCSLGGGIGYIDKAACAASGGTWVEGSPDYSRAFNETTGTKGDFVASVSAADKTLRDTPVFGSVYGFVNPSEDLGSVARTITDPQLRADFINYVKENPGTTALGAITAWAAARSKRIKKGVENVGSFLSKRYQNKGAAAGTKWNPKTQTWEVPPSGTVIPGSLNKTNILTDAAIAYAVPTALSEQGAGLSNVPGFSETTKETQINDSTSGETKIDTSTSKEKQGEQALSILEQMKTKDYWMKPMSGAPGDTRMSRIGRLISEMGTAPHLRQGSVSDDFAKRANEAGAINQRALAALNTTPDSAVGELSIKNIATRIRPQIALAMGKNKWTQLDPSEENVEAAAIDIATRAQERELEFGIPFSEALKDILKLQAATGWSGYNI